MVDVSPNQTKPYCIDAAYNLVSSPLFKKILHCLISKNRLPSYPQVDGKCLEIMFFLYNGNQDSNSFEKII